MSDVICVTCGANAGPRRNNRQKYCASCAGETRRKAARERVRRWRAKNPEAARERKRRWQAKNPEAVREHNRRWRAKNLEAERERRRRWRAKNPEAALGSARRRNLKRAGLDLSTLPADAVARSQWATCELCGRRPKRGPLAIDHCHAGGHYRGLLCDRCNRGLGCFRDKPNLLRLAALYLEERVCKKG